MITTKQRARNLQKLSVQARKQRKAKSKALTPTQEVYASDYLICRGQYYLTKLGYIPGKYQNYVLQQHRELAKG